MAATAVLVLGMHRSGTSALTGALQALGLPLGGELVAAAADNPRGYFEHAQAVQLDEALLAALGRGWEDPRGLPDGWQYSDAAQQAQARIAALLREDFADTPLWALKDPRLCRLLPLWQRVLADSGVRPLFALMLRHPDEVAASLQARDGLHPDHAYLLWLHYTLEAERATRGEGRALLDYAQLLSAPDATLQTLGAALAIAWPVAPAAMAVQAIDAGERHHRVVESAAANDDGTPRALALSAYARLRADGGNAASWPALDAVRVRAEALVAAAAPWLDGMGRALAQARRGRMAAEQRYLQTESALDAAKQLSLARLDELHAGARRLTETDAALDAAKALSLSRLQELQTQGARLAETDAALEAAKALSLARLQDVQALDARLTETDAALDAAKALSLSRLQELQKQGARLAETDTALDAAKALSLSRLADVQALDARLSETDAALDAAKALSLSRLAELQALDARLTETDAALRAASALSIARMHELQALDARLQQTDAALDEVRAQAQSRHARDAEAIAVLGDNLQAVETQLRAVLASRSWRVTRPLRWLLRTLTGGRAS